MNIHANHVFAGTESPLDWEPQLETYQTRSGALSGKFQAIVGKGKVLGQATRTYEIFGNAHLKALAGEIARVGNLQVAGFGEFHEGARVWAQLVRNSEVEGYGRNIVLLSGHNGTDSLKIVDTLAHYVCWNLAPNAQWSLKHTRNIHARAKQIVDAIAEASGTFHELEQDVRNFRTKPMSSDEFCAFAFTVVRKAEGENREQLLRNAATSLEEASENIKTRTDNAIAELHALWSGDGLVGDYGEDRERAWNAFTQWIDHKQADTDVRRSRAALSSVEGTGADTKRRARNILRRW